MSWQIEKEDEILIRLDELIKQVNDNAARSSAEITALLNRMSTKLIKAMPTLELPDNELEFARISNEIAEIGAKLDEFAGHFAEFAQKNARAQEELIGLLKKKRKYTYTFERDYHDRVTGATIEES